MAHAQHSLTLIVNPTAGRGNAARALPSIERLLRQGKIQYTVKRTISSGHARVLALEAIQAGERFIVAVGGDGTLHEVSSAMMETPEKIRRDLTLGLIPFGTGNDFARCVGLFGGVQDITQTLIDGERQPIDVGLIEGVGISPPKPFLVAAGIGFVADTAATVNSGIRFLRGAPAYIYGAIQTLARFKPLSVTLTIDNQPPRTLRAMLVSVSNVASTGGGLMIAPDAKCSDGLFDVCLVSALPKLELLTQLPNVARGLHTNHPAVSMFRVRSIKLESQPPSALWIDGEVTGSTPATLTIQPGALMMQLPRPSAAEKTG